MLFRSGYEYNNYLHDRYDYSLRPRSELIVISDSVDFRKSVQHLAAMMKQK